MLENIINKSKLRTNGWSLFFTSILSVFGTSGLNCGGKYDLDDTRYCADKDNDGFGDKRCFEGNAPKDSYIFSPIGAGIPKGYVDNHSDCEDNNNLINPEAKELCNGIDDNCNGKIDEFATPILWYKDGDGDGYGSESYVLDCPMPKNYVNNKDDCDDSKVLVHPGAKEICNLIDDNCNGITDEDITFSTYCHDVDKDGQGNSLDALVLCAPKEGYILSCDDCDDTNKEVYLNATEICDGLDNNCNGKTDEDTKVVCKSDCGEGYIECVNGKFTKCNALIPQKEICDGVDNNCNGKIDDSLDCCVNGTKKNEKYCPGDDTLKGYEVCENFKDWKKITLFEQCPAYKWTCQKGVIGVVDINAKFYNFTPKKPTNADIGSYTNQNGIGEWCCKDDTGQDWGVEYHTNYFENFLKKTCSCISKIVGIDDNTKNNPSNGKKEQKGIKEKNGMKDVFYTEAKMCPKHEYNNKETSIGIIVENLEDESVVTWLNWFSYGYPPTEKAILGKNEEHTFAIGRNDIPTSGTEVEICTSRYGCSERVYLQSGENKELHVYLAQGRIYGLNELGQDFSFGSLLQEYISCEKKTVVKVTFANEKTMDLVPWLNWLSTSRPVGEKVVLHPTEQYTYVIDETMIPQEGLEFALCTSSYGCFTPQKIECGDQKSYSLRWMFGRIAPEKR